MKIKVTKDIIKKSTKSSLNHCAISNAMTNQIGGEILVDYDVIKINKKCYRPTSEVRKFVNDFDSGKRVQPIEFDTDDFMPTSFDIHGIGLRGRVEIARQRGRKYSMMVLGLFLIVVLMFINFLING